MLKINPRKTKNARENPLTLTLKTDTESIEIVQKYTSLVTFISNWKVYPCIDHLTEKAMHAFSNIQKHTLLSRLNPNTPFQIFDTLISYFRLQQ